MISVARIRVRTPVCRAGRAAALVLAAALAGCAVGPDYRTPSTEVSPQFLNAGREGFATDAATETLWWRQFDDPALDALVEQALSANHDVRIAVARVAESRAIFRDIELDQFPIVNLNASYEDREAQLPGFSAQRREITTYRAGFDAAWELDIWGRVRRSVQAADADAQSAEATLRDVRVSAVAEVARNYYELRGAQQRLDVARRNLENQRQTLGVAEARVSAGRSTELDTSRATAQLKATEASIPLIETAVKRAEHRLAVLTGKQPGQIQLPSASQPLPRVAKRIAVGKPEELLRRRPDIRAAERGLAASTARVGVATADLFPRVNVTGFLGFITGFGGQMFTGDARASSFGASIGWAAFDFGSVRARLRAAEARSDASLAFYEQTVLRALEETENAFVNYGRQQARLQTQIEQTQALARAVEIAQLRYREGITDFLSLLDAQRSLLEAEDGLTQTETQSYTALIAVYKSLGGGWEVAEPPPAADAQSRESRGSGG